MLLGRVTSSTDVDVCDVCEEPAPFVRNKDNGEMKNKADCGCHCCGRIRSSLISSGSCYVGDYGILEYHITHIGVVSTLSWYNTTESREVQCGEAKRGKSTSPK